MGSQSSHSVDHRSTHPRQHPACIAAHTGRTCWPHSAVIVRHTVVASSAHLAAHSRMHLGRTHCWHFHRSTTVHTNQASWLVSCAACRFVSVDTHLAAQEQAYDKHTSLVPIGMTSHANSWPARPREAARAFAGTNMKGKHKAVQKKEGSKRADSGVVPPTHGSHAIQLCYSTECLSCIVVLLHVMPL